MRLLATVAVLAITSVPGCCRSGQCDANPSDLFIANAGSPMPSGAAGTLDASVTKSANGVLVVRAGADEFQFGVGPATAALSPGQNVVLHWCQIGGGPNTELLLSV